MRDIAVQRERRQRSPPFSIADDRDATPQSRGLLAIAEGFHLLEVGDHRQLELSLPVYDALYAWCKNEVAAIA